MIDLLKAIHSRTRRKRPPYWTDINPVMQLMRCTNLIECDRAILYSLRQNWISVNPTLPIHSLCLTRYGLAAIGQGPQ